MRRVALAAALVGGVVLVANLYVDRDAVSWAGLALLGVAVAVVGAGLVRVAWLRLVSAAGSVALSWAVLESVREVAPDRELEAVLGGLATLCVAIATVRGNAGSRSGG